MFSIREMKKQQTITSHYLSTQKHKFSSKYLHFSNLWTCFHIINLHFGQFCFLPHFNFNDLLNRKLYTRKCQGSLRLRKHRIYIQSFRDSWQFESTKLFMYKVEISVMTSISVCATFWIGWSVKILMNQMCARCDSN